MSEPIRQGDIPGVQLRYRHRLPADPATCWPWLTEPAQLERWLGATQASTEGGGRLEVTSRDENGNELRERLRTLEAEPPHLWMASLELLDHGWQAATRVTFELSATEAGSEIMVFHQGFEQLSFTICLTEWETYRRRWRNAFSKLERELAAA